MGVSGGGAAFAKACINGRRLEPPPIILSSDQWEAPRPWFRCTDGPSEMHAAANSSHVPRWAEAKRCDGVSNENNLRGLQSSMLRESVTMLPFPDVSSESSSSGFHAHDEGASN